MLDAIGEIFEQHPRTSRTLYLVDEEFIGRGDNAVERALAVADTLAGAGFAWETSCRIDQIVRLDRDRAWHLERAELWRGLVVRFTYILFDPLMTESELRATFAFQGRTDLLLRAQLSMGVKEIVDGVRDEAFVAEHTIGHPFYTGISYLLVSMECLIGAAYTRKTAAAGLTGQADPTMGRVETKYADWRIGVLSNRAQLWIDRNFALDYTLKSLEKILDDQSRHLVRGLRYLLKQAAYQLLDRMIELLDRVDIAADRRGELQARYATLADTLIDQLRADLAPAIAAVERGLSADHRQLLQREHTRWTDKDTWQLINAADPCGS